LDVEFGFRLMNRADHVDILGATPLNEAIVKIAAGRGDLVTDQIDSGILEYVEKMKWD
jgi:phospholipid:diacylglycerol acyltransferase